MNMAYMSIRTKLTIGYLIVAALVLFVGLQGIRSVDQVKAVVDSIVDETITSGFTLQEVSRTAESLLAQSNEVALLYVLEADDEVISAEQAQLDETNVEINALIDEYAILNPARSEALAENISEFQEQSSQLVAAARAGDAELLLETKETFEQAEQRVFQAVSIAFAAEGLRLGGFIQSAENEADGAFRVILATTVVAIIAAILAGLFISRSISKPIQTLTTTALKLSKGDFAARADVESTDEVGSLAFAFNELAKAIETRDRQIQESNEQIKERMKEAHTARTEAEQSNKVKSSFLASMSHELRTPLNSIINFTKFLVRGIMGPVNEEQEETLHEIIESSEHLLSLINDVLDMSKIESGSLTLLIEDNVNVNDLLDMVVSTGESLLNEKPVTLIKDVDPSLPVIRADRQRILQIMLNVVSNACKFTETGEIKISADYDEHGEIRLAIKDSGPGIPKEEHDYVFESFKQAKTGLRQGGGTGLGMPISKSLAEAHGGKLWFESEVGEGTTFYVTLPVMSEELVPTI